ncbi:MAG: HD domain-containing protein [Lachnospiraceae bacterium]|nr:HD domain-containing protein [Lachnospiraceae bacterium]
MEQTQGNKNFARQALFILIGVLLNIIPNRIVGALGLPIFLDNLGTFTGAIYGGYLPGILVGYLANIVNMTGNPENGFYAVLSAMIAATATYLADKGFFTSLRKALLTVPIFAFIGGVIGSVLTYLMYGFGIGEGISAPFARELLESGRLSVFQAQLISDVVIDLVDKFLMILIVYAVIKIIPTKPGEATRFTGWKQAPLSREALELAKKRETRSAPLRTKIIVIISVIMIFVAFVTTIISYLLYRNFAIEQYTNTGISVAKLAASTIDSERVGDYLTDGEQAAGYIETEERLKRIKETSPEIEYLYVYQILEDGCHVVFDLDTEEEQGGEPGTVIPFDASFTEYIPSLLAGENIEPLITKDTYGWLLTDYEPIYDAGGRCVAYAAADIQMEDVTLTSINFLTKVGSLSVGFFIFILVLCVWVSDYNLIYPLTAMTYAASRFAYDSDEAMEDSVARMQRLMIRTGDEIENLYDAVSKTIAETVGYLDEVKEKGEELAHIQNGLIYVLADLVESRDKNTGDHVRKTAAYVRMLLKRMKEEGVYADQLTDEFIEDVGNSAPLHDVGKIKVSDTILNKPGKLTDEEFATMKSHTTAGSEIIDSAIALVSDSGYLKEAKNLATYHHEKWDGSGYPTGLSGEDIPLSARVMAIADVFDALVSRRSYKEPFTFEKAMDIIKEGSGKHFDPKLVEVFVAAEDEVRTIAAENEKKTGQQN